MVRPVFLILLLLTACAGETRAGGETGIFGIVPTTAQLCGPNERP